MLKSDPANTRIFDALGTLLLSQHPRNHNGDQWFAHEIEYVSKLNREQLHHFLKQAEMQRVLRRTLAVLHEHLPRSARSPISELLDQSIADERARVEKVLTYLHRIVDRFEQRGREVMAMKTLDHWPDTGSDLDLLAIADDAEVCAILEHDLQATKEPQSWGDRLAHKFNFRIPGLPELVEVHVGCLGQTGEQNSLAAGVLSRRIHQSYGEYSLPVPVPEDRIVIATLQRMYRHYYIRLTDIVNIYGLLAEERVDFQRLTIVNQHGIRYGSKSIALPEMVTAAARFSSKRTYVDRKFVRVPLVPEAADLFLHQLAGTGRQHNFRAMMRLSLLPVLATAAFVSFRVTGNDKGVW
ncbi:MAG: hypothetical protein DMG81_06665 [Acidobacteria bacterium]|nr:MAG: hypothetical protein DMG81_06665 [Acidobacteriota bacterium]